MRRLMNVVITGTMWVEDCDTMQEAEAVVYDTFKNNDDMVVYTVESDCIEEEPDEEDE